MPHIRVHTRREHLFPQVIRFAIPLLLTNLLQQANNIIDNMIAGNFAGDLALAAVGATTHLNSMLLNLLMGISVGVSTVAAQMEGAKNKEGIRHTVHTAIALAILCGAGLGILGIVFCKPILAAMSTPESILGHSATYMRIIFAGMIFTAVYNFGAGLFRARGDTKKPLVFLAISGVVKVGLNYLLIAVLRQGVAAMALTTMLSQALAATLVVVALLRQDETHRLCFRKIRIHKFELRRILRTGVPIGLQTCSLAFSNVVIQSSINSFGDLATAGAAAANTYNSLFYAATHAAGETVTIFCGRLYGARQYKRIPVTMLCCGALLLAVSAVIAAVFFPFASQLVGLFVSDPQAISGGVQIVQVLSLSYILSGLQDISSGSLQATGKSAFPMFSTLLFLCLGRIVWVYTYFAAHRSLQVLYFSYPLSWLLTFTANMAVFLFFYRKLRKTL